MLIRPPDPSEELANLEASSQPLLKHLYAIKVASPEEQKNAEDLLIVARRARTAADEKRKQLTRPLDEAKRRIIQLFEPYINRLDTGINILNRELTAYHESLLELQRQAQRKALEEQAARMTEAQQTGEVVDLPQATTLPNVAKTSRAHLGTVTYRDDLAILIINPDQVPRDLCEPSMPRIRARVKSGVTNIPGVLVTTNTVSVTRT